MTRRRFLTKRLSRLAVVLITMIGLLFARPGSGWAQRAAVTGTVLDADTQEGIPMATVYFKQTPQQGTSTDVNGKFTLPPSSLPGDTLLVISSIGFESQTVAAPRRPGQTVRVQLKTATTQLGEVVVRPTENPAYAIIRQAVARKERNSIQSLESYQLESYNRLTTYLTNTARLQNARALRQVKDLMQRQGAAYRDAQGQPLIPLTATETVSNVFYRRQPQAQREEIVRTHTAGIGLEADDGVTQLLSGNGFRDYNFYQNRLRVLDKSLPSPLADGWRFNYEFWLEDSVKIGNDDCYRIAVVPRRATDLAFTGTIWISRHGYGLRQLDLHLAPEANINYVKRLRIRQEGELQPGGTWLAKSTRYEVELDLQSISKVLPGVALNLLSTNSHLEPNKALTTAAFEESPFPVEAYTQANTIADSTYWKAHRLPVTDSAGLPAESFALIDSLKQLPSIQAYTRVGRVFASGYLPLGKVDVGNLVNTYAWNNVEGHRVGIGLRTNEQFSRRLNLEGLVAYGTRNQRLNYNAAISQVISNRRFTQVGARFRSDVEPVAQLAPGTSLSSTQVAFNHWGLLDQRNPYTFSESAVWLEREVQPGLTTRLTVRNLALTQVGEVLAQDFELPGLPGQEASTSELEATVRFNRQQRAIRTKTNKLRPLQRQVSLTITGVVGLREADSDRVYEKLVVGLGQRQVSVLGLGTADYQVQAGYVFGAAPYALLKVHQGNGTPLLFRDANQTMRPFEFVSDQYVELHYTHYFNDLILGQLPGVRTLNKHLGWRLLATTNVVWGGLRPENVRFNQVTRPGGTDSTLPFRTLGTTPFIEAGYGVENIFHFLRVDFVHRLTYRDSPSSGLQQASSTSNNFGIRLSAAFKF